MRRSLLMVKLGMYLLYPLSLSSLSILSLYPLSLSSLSILSLSLLLSLFSHLFSLLYCSSGKTHTMQGRDDDGIIPRLLHSLFKSAQQKKENILNAASSSVPTTPTSSDSNNSSASTGGKPVLTWDVKFSCKYIEIYNEQAYDLLDENEDRKEVNIVSKNKVIVAEATEKELNDAQSALQLFKDGMCDLNFTLSRSLCSHRSLSITHSSCLL